MLYNVYYYDAKTGRKSACSDSDRFALNKAPAGEVCHLVNTNCDGHSFWMDDQGKTTEDVPWVIRQAMSDDEWLRVCLKPEHFAADHQTALLWLDTVRRDGWRRPADVAHIRCEIEAGRKVTLYAKARRYLQTPARPRQG